MLKPWLNGRYGHIARFNDPPEGDNGGGAATGGGETDTGSGGGAAGNGGGEPTIYEAANYVSDAKALQHPIFEGAKSVDDIVRVAVEQNAKVGVGNLQMPGEDATTEELDAFYSQLGRPKEASEYSFGTKGKDENGNELPGDFEDALVEGFKGAFHRAGLNNKQADTLYNEMAELQKAHNQAIEAEVGKMHEGTEKMLKQRYGAALPQKMQKMQEAVRAIAGPDAPEIEKMLEDQRFGSNPVIMSFLIRLGERVGEPSLRGGNSASNPNNMTPAQAQEEANKIIGDNKSPYWDATHPQHTAIREKVQALFRAANPEE